MSGKLWTSEELVYLKSHYSDTPMPELVSFLNRTERAIYSRVKIMKLKRSEAFLNSPISGRMQPGSIIGKNARFLKGHVPVNKGKKMSPEVYEKVKQTFFKKGNIPHNVKSDGEISIRSGYKYIRISLGEWELLHRVVWEKTNGRLPEGMNVVFKDGNPMNVEIENLEIVSNSELMDRNTIHRYPQNLKQVIRLNHKLNRKLNSHGKE